MEAARASNGRPEVVSIVVPCYQVRDHVDECVQSALGQSYRAIEVVLVDDGSTDGTAARLARWAGADDRVRIVEHEDNRGLGAARNSGVAAAEGDFLFFLDADDVLPRDAIARMTSSAVSSGADIVSGVAVRFDSSGESRAAQYRGPFDHDRVGTHIFSEPALVYDQMACSKLYRRAFWDDHRFRFPEGVLFEDVALVMRAHCSARTVDLLAQPTYRWRRRESGRPSITQDRRRSGSAAARFDALCQADAYLERHAPVRVWEEHGVKIFTVDVRIYSQLLADGSPQFVDEFMSAAGALARRSSPDAVTRLSPVMVEVRRALLEGDARRVADLARLYSGSERRRRVETLAAAGTMMWHDPGASVRIGRAAVGRALRRVDRFRPTRARRP